MTEEQLCQIISSGYSVWNGEVEKLLQWLITPCKALGNNKPINCTYKEVIEQIKRIEYGVYS